MLTDDQINLLRGYGNVIVQRLKEELQRKKINASGDLSASIRYEADDEGLRIYALNYVVFANFGRRPGKMPPRDAIKDWIEEKNLVFDIPIDSLAFLIQRKIGKEGTNAWEVGGTNFIAAVITDDLIREITNTFAEDMIKNISTTIFESYGIKQ